MEEGKKVSKMVANNMGLMFKVNYKGDVSLDKVVRLNMTEK